MSCTWHKNETVAFVQSPKLLWSENFRFVRATVNRASHNLPLVDCFFDVAIPHCATREPKHVELDIETAAWRCPSEAHLPALPHPGADRR
jgi:hypothetical protein